MIGPTGCLRDADGRYHRRFLTTVAVFAVVIMVVTDWPLGSFSDFWVEHSFLAGMASGGGLLLLTTIFVESWLKKRDARRWEGVRRVAGRDVATALQAQRWVMWSCLFGGESEEVRLDLPDDSVSRVDAALKSARLPIISHRDASRGVKAVAPEAEERLQLLLGDPSWVSGARELLRASVYHTRRLLSAWTSTLAVTEMGLEMVGEVADQVDALTSLLEQLDGPVREGRALEPESRSAFIDRWLCEFANAIAFNEALSREGGRGLEWSSRGRRLVRPVDRKLLEERDSSPRRTSNWRLYTSA